MSGAHTVALDLSQTDAIDAITAALATQGFGVLTTNDVRATLKAKLGEDIEDYTISGPATPHPPTRRSQPSPRSDSSCPATSPCAKQAATPSSKPSTPPSCSRWQGTAARSPHSSPPSPAMRPHGCAPLSTR